MTQILDALRTHDLMALIETVGLIGVWSMIFAESGLLIGFFLPGDSLLFTAGFLASPGVEIFGIYPLLIGSWIAAVVGDNVGYEFGKRFGRKLFFKEDSLLFKKENLVKAEDFYKEHGGKALVLARFMPVVRTFVPIVAGIGKMDHMKFTFYNFLGGTIWVFGVGSAGYFLGSLIPDIDKYLLPIVLGIIIVSIAPPIIHFYKDSKETPIDHAKMALKWVRYTLFPVNKE
jgi:membrane-associated protein